MPRPDTHDFACNAGLLAATDEGVSKLMRVVVGQKPFHARGNRVEVGVLRFLKVDIGQRLFALRRKGDLSKDDILSQPLLACLQVMKTKFAI